MIHKKEYLIHILQLRNKAEEQISLNNREIVKGEGNILFVDDELEIVKLGQKMLTNAGYSVITALSGEDALGYFEVGKVKIDLMITDMAMPGMTGKKLAIKALKKLGRFEIF